jgi:xanthine dehydrogenase small subunit
MFLPMAAGQEVYTVEALASRDELHVVQRAIADAGGSQCGYCTPGFVMSLFAEHTRPGRTGPCNVQALWGNLCRCTGYRPIRDAAMSLQAAPSDKFLTRLISSAPQLRSFTYQHDGRTFSRPDTLWECLTRLQRDPEAKLVAGNTDLGVESNLKDKRYAHLVSVEAIPELREFHESNQSVEIGAGLSLDEIELRWTNAPDVVRSWFSLFASPLIRNRATLGGNLSTASPIGDAAPLLLALDAHVTIASVKEKRSVSLNSFFTGYRQTVLQHDEILVSVSIPKPYPAMAQFYKAAKRRVDDISTVAACFAMSLDRSGRVDQARIAFGGVAAVPRRVQGAEEALIGEHWNDMSLRRAQGAVASALTPMSDHRGSAEYRLALAQSLLDKFRYEMGEVEA